MKKFLLSLYFTVLCIPICIGQNITNYTADLNYRYCRNYDFNANTTMGPAYLGYPKFKININSQGKGNIFLVNHGANGGYGQSASWTIDKAYYDHYNNNGKEFIKIIAHNSDYDFVFRIDLRGKHRKIKGMDMMCKADNRGEIFYN